MQIETTDFLLSLYLETQSKLTATDLYKKRKHLIECYKEGQTTAVTKELPETILCYCNAIEDIYFVRAIHALNQETLNKATYYFERCLSKNPLDTLSYLLLSDTLLKLQRPYQTINILQKALALNLQHPRIQNTLGIAYRAVGKHQLAEKHFLLALSKKPGFSSAITNLVNLYIEQNHYLQAVNLLKKRLFLCQEKELTMKKIGQCYLLANQLSKAIFWYRLSKSRSNKKAHLTLLS
jgi:tetratricopeptide (TPR) repeat protein